MGTRFSGSTGENLILITGTAQKFTVEQSKNRSDFPVSGEP